VSVENLSALEGEGHFSRASSRSTVSVDTVGMSCGSEDAESDAHTSRQASKAAGKTVSARQGGGHKHPQARVKSGGKVDKGVAGGTKASAAKGEVTAVEPVRRALHSVLTGAPQQDYNGKRPSPLRVARLNGAMRQSTSSGARAESKHPAITPVVAGAGIVPAMAAPCLEGGGKGAAPQAPPAPPPLRMPQRRHDFDTLCKGDAGRGAWLDTLVQADVGGAGGACLAALGSFHAPAHGGPPWGMEYEDEKDEVGEEGAVAAPVESGQGWWVASVEDLCPTGLEDLPNDGFMSAFSNSFQRLASDEMSGTMGCSMGF